VIDFEKMTSFTTEYMASIAFAIKNLVQEDARKGIMQDNSSGLGYKSRKYTAQKSKGTYNGTGRRGNAQVSTNTSYVDMHLTGDLFDSMTISSTPETAIVAVDPLDEDKITTNEHLGRVIIDLRDENVDTITEKIAQQINDNIEELNNDVEISMSITI